MRWVLLVLLLCAMVGAIPLLCRREWRHEFRVWIGAPTLDDAAQSLVPRIRVSAANLPAHRMVILVTGQSNTGNYGRGRKGPIPNVFNFYHDTLFRARDPTLGSDSLGASPWVRFGDSVVRSRRTDAVVLALAVRGGTPVREWRQGEPMYHLAIGTAIELMQSNLQISHVFWQQGEADCPPYRHTSKAEYEASFAQFIGGLRRAGVKAPIFVASATRGLVLKPAPPFVTRSVL